MDNTELVAAYARNQQKADLFAQKYGCAAYSDLEQFIQHSGMDVVTIGSVSGVHLDHVSVAAKAGKHIICEKPLEVTPARVDEMIKICDEAGVMLSGIFPAGLMIQPIFLRRHWMPEGLGKLCFVILPLNGGGRRNTTIAEHGVEPGI